VEADLGDSEQVTSYALVPPAAGAKDPLLAVAAWDTDVGEPVLAVFHARTGARLRHYKGHAGHIRALGVSPDGKLLASAAADRLVCLWSLADLDKILGKQGALTGVVLRQDGKKLVVARLDKPRPEETALREGDVITGLAFKADEQKRGPLSAHAFCDALWGAAPGDPVWVAVDRDGRETRLALTVGQGVDERKPLLFLFVAAGDPRAPRRAPEWIAWTPLGPFDSSGGKIEDRVGWSFNPARPGDAPRFEELNAHRKKYHEPRLLENLVTRADLHGALDEIRNEIPPAEVRIASVGGVAEADPEGHYLVRTPEPEVKVRVEGPSLAHQVDSVVIKVDGRGEPVDLRGAGGQTLVKRLKLPRRGVYTVQVEVRTRNDAQPPSRTAPVKVRYQPPAPEITLDGVADAPGRRLVVKEGTYKLRAHVRPYRRAEDVTAGLWLNGRQIPDVTADKDGLLEAELTLRPGEDNVVEVRAQNKNALERYRTVEEAQLPLVLVFEKAPQPRFTEVEIDPGTDAARRVAVKAGEPLVVDAPAVRLFAEVASSARLKEVELFDGEKLLKTFDPKGETTFTLDHDLKGLKPGEEHPLVLRAKTMNSDPGRTLPLRLEYRPPLPVLRLTEPRADLVLVEGRDRKGVAEVEVKGLFLLPRHFHPFEVVIAASGDRGDTPPVVKKFAAKEEAVGPGGQPVSLGTLSLRRGDHSVRVGLRIPVPGRPLSWASETPIETQVTFRRPPFLTAPLKASSPVKTPFTDVTAAVQFPEEAPLTEVRVNDVAYDPGKVLAGVKVVGGIATGTIAVKGVRLTAGAKESPVVLQVRNADGSARDKATVRVDTPPPPPPTVKVYLLPDGKLQEEPVLLPDAGRVSQPDLVLQVRVAPPAEVRRVTIAQDGAQPEVLKDARVTAGQLEYDHKLRLHEGVNLLLIRAEVDGNRAEKSVAVTYQPASPVEIIVDRPPPTSQGARLPLKGRVRVRDGQDRRLAEEAFKKLRVYVNEFHQQLPLQEEDSADRGAREVRFSAPVVLNREDNRIVVESPDVPHEAGGRQTFTVRCPRPEPPSRLYLVILNPGTDKLELRQLVRHAREALQIESGGRGPHSKVFREVILPRGLEAANVKVTRQIVYRLLDQVDKEIADNGGPSDVVLIYWLGKEALNKQGEWYLETDEVSLGEDRSVTGVPLAQLLPPDRDGCGARVLLLDVATPGEKARPFDWSRSHAGVVRLAGKAPGSKLSLLAALQEAAQGRREVSLEDAARAAEKLQAGNPGLLLELTRHLSDLARLIVTRQDRPADR
jgi:hypothetical protein